MALPNSTKVVQLDCAGKLLCLDRPRVMGILNLTPDSFSDGGQFLEPARALEQAQRMVEAGADIIDIGGESTRPGAPKVSVEQELARVLPIIERLAADLSVPLSLDTYKPDVMRAGIAAGVGLINDINALRDPQALTVLAAAPQVAVCLMHMQGTPQTMQQQPQYKDVVQEVTAFLAERVQACEQAGIARARLVLDPGYGFGKTVAHNYQLLRAQPQLIQALGLPILAGLSRKSMLGAVTGRGVEQRLAASVAAATLAAVNGAQIIRVHDVAATVDALNVYQALLTA